MFGFISGRLSGPSGDDIIADLMQNDPSVRNLFEAVREKKLHPPKPSVSIRKRHVRKGNASNHDDDIDEMTEEEHEQREERLMEHGLAGLDYKKDK